MKKFTLLFASMLLSVGAAFAETPANGVYEIKHSDRGYITQNVEANTLHPGDATLSGYTGSDKCVVSRNENGYNAYWYLYTSATSGNSYIFSASNGLFIAYGNGTGSGTLLTMSEDPVAFTLAAATTAGYYQIHPQGVTATAVSNSIGWGKDVAYRFTGMSDYDGIPHTFVTTTQASDTEVINAAIAKIQAIESTQRDITFTFPAFGENTLTMTVAGVEDGTDASTVIPAVSFFTSTGIEETNVTVSEENVAFTVAGTWSFPFESDKVYRVDIRKKENSCNNLYYNSTNNQIDARNNTDANAFIPERLFYLSSNGFSAVGQLKVTLHTLAVEANKGFQVATENRSIGTLTETPTEFLVVTNSTGTEGISLQHPDNNICHVNDIDGNLGVWTEARSQNDGGSFLRFFALTDDDFAVYNGVVDQDVYEAAQSSHSAASVRALLEAAPADYVAAVTAANALLATIEGYNYTEEHFGDGLGYFSGTSYETILSMVQSLNEAIAGKEVDAITAATTALQEEVSKVTLNLPQAGKYYRFKGYEGGWYVTPTSATGQMAMAETANANSAFLFNAVDGQTNVFTPHNVAHNTGITGTHSLGGSETYTFNASESGYPGAFTIKSNYDGSQYVYNHYDNSSPVVNRNSGYHTRCNWILEEVDENGVTGIEEIVVESEKMQGIYDLQGRKLSAPVKGINIINGKKVLVK